jgi:hypothetical protein
VLTYSRGSAFTNYDLVLKAADCVTTVVSYDEENNLNLTSTGAKSGYAMVGKVAATTNGVITSFQPKLPFRAVDQNDFNKLDEEVVKTSGNQTIAGTKTFTTRPTITADSPSKLFLQSKTIDIDVNPSSNQTNQLWFVDKNGYQYAVLQANQNTDGMVAFSMTMKAKKANNYATLQLLQSADASSTWVAVPTPPTNATGTQAVNADWVRRKIAGITRPWVLI